MFSVAATAEYLSAIMAGAATAVQKSSDGSRLLISWGCSSAAFFLILTGTQLALKRLRITTGKHAVVPVSAPCKRLTMTDPTYVPLVFITPRSLIYAARPPFAASMIGVFAVATAGVASSRIFSILYYDSPSPTSAERKQRKNLSKEYGTELIHNGCNVF
jgi:hypothetical protein